MAQKAAGQPISEAIKGVRKINGISLGEAKQCVASSQAYGEVAKLAGPIQNDAKKVLKEFAVSHPRKS